MRNVLLVAFILVSNSFSWLESRPMNLVNKKWKLIYYTWDGTSELIADDPDSCKREYHVEFLSKGVLKSTLNDHVFGGKYKFYKDGRLKEISSYIPCKIYYPDCALWRREVYSIMLSGAYAYEIHDNVLTLTCQVQGIEKVLKGELRYVLVE